MADNIEATAVLDIKTKTSSDAQSKSSAPVGRDAGTHGEVIVHVRFHPNGRVNMVNHRPANVDPQDWFDMLARRTAASCYQAFSGGRGVFRIQVDAFETIWREAEA
ncbi:hypothetical protein [Methylocapsa acidiphila]|uniref:hypothetical protein n=1 Tax=Methylocapsa acidiphila TaxID=133552 RepID=UPI0003FDD4B8|nr:hypothetical protein [Methylocapsa acidiphila]